MRIFASVGNPTQPFDRMLRAVDDALANYPGAFDGVCQHGPSVVRPRDLTPVAFLGRAEFEGEVARADILIVHAGVGSVSAAIRGGRRPIVFARRSAFGEHVDDHQRQLVAEFEAADSVFAAEDGQSLARLLGRLLRNEVSTRTEPRAVRPDAVSLVGAAVACGRPPQPYLPGRRTALVVLAATGRLLRPLQPRDALLTRSVPENSQSAGADGCS